MVEQSARPRVILSRVVLVGILCPNLWNLSAEDLPPQPERVREAIRLGLQILARSVATYPEHRTCFSCHHQTLPMQAMRTAREHGFKIDEALFQAQTGLTHATFKARAAGLRQGTGIGGNAMTVGYGLWALDLGDSTHDDTTSAMVAYLLKTQKEDGRFWSNTERPPLEDSAFTSTTLASYYMQKFAGAGDQVEVQRSVEAAKRWLLQSQPDTQEDCNSRFWGLHLLGADADMLDKARRLVLQGQRTDGGWGQLAGLASDAYATGQSLFVLQASGLPTDHPAYQSGIRFLLESQRDDGSWKVQTRSKPIQIFFDSGFPHGKDQFISICATSWAVAALAAASR